MRPIRIHLGHMPAMLLGIVRDLVSAEPDLIVVGCSRAGDDDLVRADQESADMVIAQHRGTGGASALDVVVSGAPCCVLAIAPDGRRAAVVDLVRRHVDLDTESKAAFVDAVRSVAEGLPC